jgi:hypothetical protein
MRTLVGSLVVAVVVASVSWSLVLIGSGDSHGASFRLAGGMRVVLHHPGEARHAHERGVPAHEHDAPGDHQHSADVPDDHVVAVSTDPASLRSHDADLLPDGAWSSFALLAVVQPTPARRASAIIRVTRGPTPLPLHRSTTVLLI